MKSFHGLWAGSVVAIVLGVSGCGGGGDLDAGVPKDVGYVPPPMQPNMGAGGKRVMGASPAEKKEGMAAAAAADAASIANPPAKP